jgi:nucleoid-associated protein YgaU
MRAVKFGVALVGLVGAFTIVPGGGAWPPDLGLRGLGWAQDVRKRAEDLAKGATERFDELVGGKGKNGQDGSASGVGPNDSLAERIYAWVSGSGRHYQDLVRRMAEPVRLNPVEDAARRMAAEQRRAGTMGAGADVPRPMVVADAGLIEQGVGWVHRSSRDYQEMMRRLSVPAEPSRVIGVSKPAPDKAAEDARKAAEAKKAEDDARRVVEAKKAEEAKQAEEARKVAEAQKAADAKKAEDDARRVAEAKKAEEAKQAEEARRVAEAQKAADAKKAEDEARRAAEAKRVVDTKKAEDDARRVAEAKKTEETKQASAKQVKEAQRAAPGGKVVAVDRVAEARSERKPRKARIAEAKRKKQARKLAEERRKYAWREPRSERRSRAQRARDCRFAGSNAALPGWYVVKKGDTLWKIASRHYHKGRLYRLIYEANTGRIDHPTRIYPCQRLYIPKVHWRRQ